MEPAFSSNGWILISTRPFDSLKRTRFITLFMPMIPATSLYITWNWPNMTSKTSKHESRKAVNEDVQLTPKLVTVNTKWRNLSDIQRGNEVNILTSDGTGFTCFHKRREYLLPSGTQRREIRTKIRQKNFCTWTS